VNFTLIWCLCQFKGIAQAANLQQLDVDGLLYLNLSGVVITSHYAPSPRTAPLATYMHLPLFDVSRVTTRIGDSESKLEDAAARCDTSGGVSCRLSSSLMRVARIVPNCFNIDNLIRLQPLTSEQPGTIFSIASVPGTKILRF